MKRLLFVGGSLALFAAAVWAATEAVKPRARDEAIEAVRREVAGSVTPETRPKPRSWAFVKTTQSGKWTLAITGPDGKSRELAAVEVVVPEGKVAEIAVRTSLVVRDENPPEPEERVEP